MCIYTVDICICTCVYVCVCVCVCCTAFQNRKGAPQRSGLRDSQSADSKSALWLF